MRSAPDDVPGARAPLPRAAPEPPARGGSYCVHRSLETNRASTLGRDEGSSPTARRCGRRRVISMRPSRRSGHVRRRAACFCRRPLTVHGLRSADLVDASPPSTRREGRLSSVLSHQPGWWWRQKTRPWIRAQRSSYRALRSARECLWETGTVLDTAALTASRPAGVMSAPPASRISRRPPAGWGLPRPTRRITLLGAAFTTAQVLHALATRLERAQHRERTARPHHTATAERHLPAPQSSIAPHGYLKDRSVPAGGAGSEDGTFGPRPVGANRAQARGRGVAGSVKGTGHRLRRTP
jgi:hypothetical protein